MRPGRKAARTKKPVRTARRKARAPRTNGTTKRNPFTGLLVTGIRSIVAALPLSSFLTPITDLLLSSIGLAPEKLSTGDPTVTQDGVSIYGLCGLVMVKYTNILARSSNAAINTTRGARVWVDTPYTDAKLTSITISATPDNKLQSRSGRWGMLIIPFRDAKDEQSIRSDYTPLTLAQLQQMAGSVSGPADRPLQLRFTPKPEDGLIYQFNPMDTYFCAVIIAYSENIRPAYHEFSADDFSPDISVKGSIRLRQPHFGSPTVGYHDEMWSPPYPAAVYNEKSNKLLTFEQEGFTCTPSKDSPKQCLMQGTLHTKKKDILSLDSMALE